MNTQTLPPSETMVQMQEAADKAAKGIRNLEEMRRAAEEMDRIRAQVLQREGVLNIGVDAIRELRDA